MIFARFSASVARLPRLWELLFGVAVIGLMLILGWQDDWIASQAQQNPTQRAYVANTASDTVSVIDLGSGTPVRAPIPVGGGPSALLVSPDQRRVYVANSQTNTVSIIDTESNAIIDTIQLRRTARPTGLALTADGSRLYISSPAGDSIFVVNTDTNSQQGLPIGVPGQPAGLIWTDVPDNRLYAVTPGAAGVTLINLGIVITRRVIETGPNPAGIALAPEGDTVYVSDLGQSNITAISTRENRVIRSLAVGNRPDSLALTPDRRRLIVASLAAPQATVLNPSDGTVMAVLPTGSSASTSRPGINRLAVSPDGLKAVVANEDDNTISLLDLKTNTARVFPTQGNQPTGVVVVGRVAVCDPARSVIDFGDVRLGGGGAQEELVITNRGTDTLQITNATIDNPTFAVSGVPTSLRPRESQRLIVRFTPTALGQQTATLTLETNDPDPDRCVISLRGFGRSPICTVAPTMLNFGVVRIAQRADVPVVIGNLGNEPLVITRVDSTDPQFGVVSSLPLSVAPGAFQTMLIGFTPAAIRLQTATLRLISNDPDSSRCVIMAQGIGQGPVCQAPGEVNIGDVPVLQTGIGVVTVSNAGDESLLISNISIDNPAFRLQPTSLPVVLAPGASVPFFVAFSPVRVGEVTALMRVLSSDPGPMRCVVRLRGTGKGAVCQAPTETNFGNVALQRSRVQTVRITNAGNETLFIFNAFIAGSSAYRLENVSFPISIAPGTDRGLLVRFTPVSLGVQTATLVLQTNDPINATCTSRLTGSGVVPPIEAFVANNGSASLSVVNLETIGSDPPPIPVQAGPIGIVKQPGGRFVYVSNFSSGTVSVVDAFSYETVQTIFIGGGPLGLAMSPTGDRLYVGLFNVNGLAIIDTANNQLISTTRNILSNPVGMVVAPEGNRLYVATPGDRTVTVVNPTLPTIPLVTQVPVGPNTTCVAISPDGSSVYASDTNENMIRVISTFLNVVVRVIMAGDGAESLTVSRDGTRLYVVNLRANTLSVIVPTTAALITNIPIGRSSATMRPGPNRVAISDDGRYGVVANADDGTVTILDLINNQVIRTAGVGRTPLGVTVVGP